MDNGKEFTRQILAEMVKIARQIFAKITVREDGAFTAYELWKCKDAMGNILHIDWNGTKYDKYEAAVGTFKFEFVAQEVFETVYKFEKLGGVKQAEKARLIKGEQIGEEIQERAMYLKDGKAVVRKKTLNKVSERVAIAPDKKTKKWELYYLAGSVWYYITANECKDAILKIWHRIDADGKLIYDLLAKWNFNTDSAINGIYKPLYEALQSEAADSTHDGQKCESEPENGVICGKDSEGITKLSENIGKDGENRVYVRIKNKWLQLVGFGGYDAEIIAEKGAHELLYLKSVLEEMKSGESGICEQNDKILSMLSEDYPPEPYNKTDTGESERPICDHAEKSANSCGNRFHVLPSYLRQKAFPTELFNARLKISCFKRRLQVGGIIYQPTGETATERTGSPNLGVYGVLIRGATTSRWCNRQKHNTRLYTNLNIVSQNGNINCTKANSMS